MVLEIWNIHKMGFYCYPRRFLNITNLKNRIRLLSQFFEGKIIFYFFNFSETKTVRKLDLKTAVKIHKIIPALSLFSFNNEVGWSFFKCKTIFFSRGRKRKGNKTPSTDTTQCGLCSLAELFPNSKTPVCKYYVKSHFILEIC